MKAFLYTAAGLLLGILFVRWREAAPAMKFGDFVAVWILVVTVGAEVVMLVAWKLAWDRGPERSRMAELRINLEMAKDAARRRRLQERGF